MNKIAVYTCIVGEYDDLLQPAVVADDFDYICFVKHGTATTKKNGVWRIVELPDLKLDNISLSRYPKLNPHICLPDYEYSLWIDGNLEICSTGLYQHTRSAMYKNVLYAGVEHPSRQCVYKEAIAVIQEGRDRLSNVLKTMRFLKANSCPKNIGLFENNIILRNHTNVNVVAANELWWSLFSRYSKRDQLTGRYCFFAHKVSCELLLEAGQHAKSYDGIKFHYHKPIVVASFLERCASFITRNLKALVCKLVIKYIL